MTTRLADRLGFGYGWLAAALALAAAAAVTVLASRLSRAPACAPAVRVAEPAGMAQ
jgi:hypothetical protein